MADESWAPQRSKLKPPSAWIVAMLRLAGPGVLPPNAIGRVVGAQAALGEALWRPPAPNGYPDTEAAWIDGVPHRLDIANEFAARVAANVDPLALLDGGPRPPRLGRDAADRRARGNPRPGFDAPCHVARIFAELTMMNLHSPSRRQLLLSSGTLFAWAYAPRLARAEGRDPRFLAIVLRGALDGLATVAPVGDPDWIALRGDNALTLDGKMPALKLNDYFALNPAMPNLNRMYAANEAIIVHACATPYRERSHFDGQDLLESGLAKPGVSDSGWLNRALSGLAAAGRVDPKGRQGLCCRSGHAADRARAGAGSVVVAAAGAAGKRRYRAAPARPLSAIRFETGERARG